MLATEQELCFSYIHASKCLQRPFDISDSLTFIWPPSEPRIISLHIAAVAKIYFLKNIRQALSAELNV